MEAAETEARGLLEAATQRREAAAREVREALELAQRPGGALRLETGDLDAFLEEPYIILPAGKDAWRVVCPRFVEFHVGMLERSTPSYNVFLVNKYARWLGDVPPALEKLFEFKPALDARVEDGMVLVPDEATQTKVWDRYKDHLTRREGSTALRVRQGREFKLISEMIQDGILPFTPRPVDARHLRAAPAWAPGAELVLRPYQEEAWRRFLETGAVGVYWPMGAGKTVIALHAFAHMPGPHLVVVPTRTLVEQWEERLRAHLAWEAREKVEVITYHAWDKLRDRMNRKGFTPYTLVVFDECHVLPADTFSKFSTLPCLYRMGLSATPYREDGRTDLIFALTGFPVGLDWQQLIDQGVVEAPDVTLFVAASEEGKVRELTRLLQEQKRTVVFCDTLDKGNALSRRFGIPYVSGETRGDRLGLIRAHRQVIVSRVGDEGLSLPDLERVVEYDFLFGSRRQEGQRMGRLFHADSRGEHWILMTEDELQRYEKRLLAIREKGFRIRVLRERAPSRRTV